ncbi:MAG TPA: endopeptidase La [Candidatus Kapabacteria bacterium]|nr:endopeptidase La [Candidatus Kapabacteria bacterium]
MSKERTTIKKKKPSAPKENEQISIESAISDMTTLVANDEKVDLKNLPHRIPVLALRDVIVFPYMVFPVLVGRESSLSATMSAMARERYLFLVAQKDSAVDDPNKDELFQYGTLARILRIIRLPNGLVKVLVDGLEQAHAKQYINFEGHIETEVEVIQPEHSGSTELEALVRHTSEQFRNYVRTSPTHPAETLMSFDNITDPRRRLFFIAAHLTKDLPSKQKILELTDIREQYLHVSGLLASEIDILKLEQDIDQKVQSSIQKSQRKYFLQEQIRLLQQELGDEAFEEHPELGKLMQQIKEAELPEAVQKKAEEELERLKKTPSMSPEAGVIRTYLEWLAQVPWHKRTVDNFNVANVKEVLDADHFALEKPKERILEHIAVLNLVEKMRGQILCFVGPPGVGKTSLARSIARSLGREFVRMSLGGVRDEAEIRGHRRTYIGALPGKIIQSMKRAGVTNPVILLDEIDKMSTDFRGDPSSALLEVLDPEQNYAFVDHYLDVDYDLSNVFFITTANVAYEIPLPLLDRMELIELPGYLEHDKLEIAKRHIIPAQLKQHGLSEHNLSLNDEAILNIIRHYTEEAGVRELVRKIAKICRKAAHEIVMKMYSEGMIEQPAATDHLSKVTVNEDGKLEAEQHKRLEVASDIAIAIDNKKVEEYLGVPKYQTSKKELDPKVGAVMGLAWTSTGGDVLPVEVTVMTGSERLTLTGQLGDVMKESAQAALSYLRSRAKQLGLKPDFMKNKEIHIHLPEGAVPKDGPSAGITLTMAMLSALNGKPARGDVAMTGEITLRGNVLPIGGLQEKLLAAQREGITTVLIPEENRKTLTEIPKKITENLTIIPIEKIDQAIEIVFGKKLPAYKRKTSVKKKTKKR